MLRSNLTPPPRKLWYRDERGVAAIEFAVIAPIMIVLALAAIEFGNYFVKREIVSSAISNVSQTLQRDPNYVFSAAEIKSMGGGYVDFTNGKNFICADSRTTAAAAAALTTPCTSNTFNTLNPSGTGSSNKYYVSVRANVGDAAITPLGHFIPAVKNITLSSSSGSTEVGSLIPPSCGNLPIIYNSKTGYQCANIPGNCQGLNYVNGAFTCTASVPTCNQTGYSLQYNGSTYQCMPNVPPGACSQPWQKLSSDGNGGYNCQNVDYVIAAGIVHPQSGGPGGAQDTADMKCQYGVGYVVPDGLPAGIIVPTGNLVYPNLGDQGAWHDWAVSFKNYYNNNNPGYKTMDICMSSGRNGFTGAVNAEWISYQILFRPN